MKIKQKVVLASDEDDFFFITIGHKVQEIWQKIAIKLKKYYHKITVISGVKFHRGDNAEQR